MKTYANLKEMQEAPEEVRAEVAGVLRQDEFSDYDVDAEDFGTLLGGDVHVVERLEDLAQVEGLDTGSEDVAYASLLTGVPEFDGVWLLPSRLFVCFFLATNNNGGPSYYVPSHVADMVPNVTEALRRANEGEEPVRTSRAALTTVSRVSPASCLPVQRQVPIGEESYRRWQAGALDDAETGLTGAELTFLKTGMTERDVALVGELE